ncbi:bifunctional indole-3-glycerol-phosphate synthase TrpC/phosphoribosylanthranilate isomerase TrpF [Paraneptunicella aestuarii]|uniref:bifunctional indole-3-glycerol-phosphate synthase TrpC/phosphoribosylanthranilate isomerase TrpF n=1 Tax=Paraneptunicella aestuarii TaxID=2831148 RepID=UPI001E3FB8A3|nr:bifunctional indole-3-glycerol-phosphate synthase TrpC/phosphoribosylanthranilate isomerase TrpF [Paraneptunicella aestuarii]
MKEKLPLEEVKKNLTPSEKSLYCALAEPHAGFILECKKASPSKGLIRENFDLDEILAAYTPHASAISVLTDEKYFQGSFDYLKYVTDRVEQPVLNKDIFIDPYQVYLARYYNADAILLMLSVLTDEEFVEMAEIAKELNLDVLTEVSNVAEAQRALKLGANMIGINNRNLRDLSTDLATTEQLAPLLSTPDHADCLLISESGIYTNQDVRRLSPLVDGFLVGSSLMAQKDLPQAVTELVHGKVKVCGITREQDALVAKAKGATYLGLIFADVSKRKIDLATAQAITQACPHRYVGVFVDEDISLVVDHAKALNLVAVQLHGNEDQEYIIRLRGALPMNCEIWKAKGVTNKLPAMDETDVDYFLLDCQTDDQSGGTGKSFDWRLLDTLADKSHLILAGGLRPSNIATAAASGVACIDINSGVESAPGIKDEELLSSAFAALREY